VRLDDVVGQGLRADRPRGPLPLPFRGSPLAHPLAHVLDIEADQMHQGFIAEQQGEQGIHAFNAEQCLQAIEPDILYIRNHLPLDGRAVGFLQQRCHPNGPQELEEIIHQGSCIQAGGPIDLLLAIQAPGHSRIIPTCHLPIQPLGQVLGELIFDLSHRPPPFANSLSAIEQSGRRIEPSAYVGISGKVRPSCQRTRRRVK
jgi:hypothetical protein